MKKRDHRFGIAALASLGLVTGWVHGSYRAGILPRAERQPSAVRTQSHPQPLIRELTPSVPMAPESINSYDQLPCPEESEYRAVAARLKLEIPDGISVCQDPNHGRLAKLLHFATTLQFDFPSFWAPELQEDLKDPVSFISRMSKKMSFDFTQSTSIAYNKTTEKSIFLGGMFFDETPLEAISVLVHEARHSSEFDQGHTFCRMGDIPKVSGGCDYFLSISATKAGAYSYGAAFYAALGLYGKGLQKSDREYLLSQALGLVGTRFNILPTELAQAFDGAAVLDHEGKVYLLHPFSKEPIGLETPFLKEGEKIERLEMNVRNNGILLYTSLNRLFTWDRLHGFNTLYDGVLPSDMPILDAARIQIPFDDYPYYHFLTTENRLNYVQFNTEQKKYTLNPYTNRTLRKNNPFIPQFHRIFMALFGESIFQDKTGEFYFGPHFGNQEPFFTRSDFQLPGKKWIHGTGGVAFETLYAIADDGLAYTARVKEIRVEDEYEEPIYAMEPSSLQAPGGRKALKMLEGVNIRALLDDQGMLTLESHDGTLHSSWSFTGPLAGKSIADFTLIRTHLAEKELLTQERNDGEFLTNCQIQQASRDPWISTGIGLNAQGHLLAASADGKSCTRIGTRIYRQIRNHIAPGDQEHFSQSSLELTDEAGKTELLRPFEYRDL